MDTDKKKQIQENLNNRKPIKGNRKADKQNIDSQSDSIILYDVFSVNQNVATITQNMNEEYQKLILNESLATYTKQEIDKLETDTQGLIETCNKLELDNVRLNKDLKVLNSSIDINRQSIRIKVDTISIVKENIDKLQAEADEDRKQQQKVYNDYLEKYKKTKKLFEDHHPLFTQLKKLQNESLKLEVEKKMLVVKINETKKLRKLRQEIQRKIFTDMIVNFGKAVLDYWKSREVSQSINEEEEKREGLLKELYEVKVLAAKKEEELHKPKHFRESSVRPTEFSIDHTWNLNEIHNKIASAYPTPSVNLTSVYDGNILLKEKQLQTEKNLEQIRARFDQMQHQWKQQPQKRTFTTANLDARHSVPKLPKNTLNPPLSNTKTIVKTTENPTFTKQLPSLINSSTKVNIISVHSIGNTSEMRSQKLHTHSINPIPQTSQQTTLQQNLSKSTTQNQNLQSQASLIKNNFQVLQAYPQIQIPQTVPDTSQDVSTQKLAAAIAKHIPTLYSQNNIDLGNQEFIKPTPPTFTQTPQTRYDFSQSQSQPTSAPENIQSQNLSNYAEPDLTARTSQSDANESLKPAMSIITNENMELMKMLEKRPLGTVGALQKTTDMANDAVTSPFFNNTNKINENVEVNPEKDAKFTNSQMKMNSYFGNLPFTNSLDDSDNSIKMDHQFSPVYLSPTTNTEDAEKATDNAESLPFNFNFGQVDSTQANRAPFFSIPSASNPFNLF